jgi:3',5'-cyclic AMP phosphodiesterase CpdA
VTKLLHISDLHFGPPYVPEAGDAILAYATADSPGAVIVTGDLTQRARVKQFVQAGAFLRQLEGRTRVVVVPGNHDIPLYRVWDRLFHPYRLFHSLVSKDRNTVLGLDKVTVVGIDSTHPLLRLTNGRLGKAELC